MNTIRSRMAKLIGAWHTWHRVRGLQAVSEAGGSPAKAARRIKQAMTLRRSACIIFIGLAILWFCLAGSLDGLVDHKSDLLAEKPIRCLGHQGKGLRVAISPNGKVVISGGADKALRFWNSADGTLIRKVQVGDPKAPGGIGQVRVLPDGKTLVALYDKLRYWDLGSGQEGRELLPIPPNLVLWSFAFSPDGAKLAIAGKEIIERDANRTLLGNDGELQMWDLKKKERVFRFQLGKGAGDVRSLVFAANGKFLAGGSLSGYDRRLGPKPIVRVWDTTDGKQVFSALESNRSAIVDLSHDGQLVCAGTESLQMWHLPSKKHLWQATPYESGVLCLALSPNSRIVATGGSATIKFWDAQTGKLVGVLEGHKSDVQSLMFSADGRVLVSAGYDNEILIWRLKAVCAESASGKAKAP